jgi:hypothetical protein
VSEITITRNSDESVSVQYQHPRTGETVSRTFVAGDGFSGTVFERKGNATFPIGRKLRRTTAPLKVHHRGLLETVQREALALLGINRNTNLN